MDIVNQKNADILVFLWASDHVKNGKLFQNVIKVNTFAYAHINIKYFDFSNDFYIFSRKVTLELALSIHPVLFVRDAFSKRQNQASNNLLFFLYPKFLEFFTPKNTPPKVKNSNLSESPFFLGHPVSSLVTSLPGSFLQSAIQSSYQYC